ncbi:MAG: hypothetical protein ACREYD_12005 [Casimicrobiaceae bacterium]
MSYPKIDDQPVRASETDVLAPHDSPTTQQRRAPRAPQASAGADSDAAVLRLRRQAPMGEPLPLTFKWMARLPRSVQPLALFRQFPRIANMMAGMWQDPGSLRPYLHDLLTDRRGHRKGFPPDVVQELLALRIHYEDIYPGMLDVYKDVDKRG